jgi:hypothetical protein
MLALVIIFAVLLISVLVLAAMRKMAGREEEQLLTHLDPAIVQQKAGIVQRIDAIEKWGKALTAVTVVYGLILLCWYLYQGWQQSGQITH